VRKAVDAYAKILKLSAEQTKAVDDIFKQAKTRKHEFFSNEKRDRDSHRSFFRKLKEEQTEKLKAVLSQEQFATYQGVQELFDRY
jgi:hypothetical protein